MAMDDREIFQRINGLDDEECALLDRGEQNGGLSEDERARLGEVHVELDQLWDLLRQRRARRHAGFDPDGARLRSGATVEDYLQ